MGSDDVNSTHSKNPMQPLSCWVKYLSLPFSLLMCYGAFSEIMKVNNTISIDYWGTLIAGLLLIISPFLMNRFSSIVLLGTGVFAVVNLLNPDFQSWLNLAFFAVLTVLFMKPHRLWFRIILQLAALGIIGVCLWYLYKDFYKGIEHFVQTGKLTEAYLNNRIKTYLPGDFSYYSAVIFIVLSVRCYLPAGLKRQTSENHNHIRNNDSDNDLWGY